MSTFLLLAAAYSAIGQIARLIVLNLMPWEIAFVAFVCHASRQRLLFRAPAFGEGLNGSLIDQTAKEVVFGSFYQWVSRCSYQVAHVFYVIEIKVGALLIIFASNSAIGKTAGGQAVEPQSVEFAVRTPAREAAFVGIPAIAA